MAITINGARFLAYSRFRGLELRRTTVVGRQGLFAPPALLRPILHRHGLTVDPEDEAFFHGEMPEWADSLFRAFGSKELEFLDVSSYEGATRLHDLNRPVGDDWEESTDTLIDAGSLEHIFDVKTAMENYLRMVRIGGNIVLLDMPAVNLCGHGFYQFSPEFFCEVFSRRHGFELVSLALAEDWAYAPFFSVARPRDVRGRVELHGNVACHIFCHARKTSAFHRFGESIAQSDYELAWNSASSSRCGNGSRDAVLEFMRKTWRRIDLGSYWSFSTRRNRVRGGRLTAMGRSPNLKPLEI